MIKTTVIIPVYNTKEYLVECIESVFNQTLKEIEVIAINDGSTDNSKIVIEKYKNATQKAAYTFGWQKLAYTFSRT